MRANVLVLCLVSTLLLSEIGVKYEYTTLSKIKKSPSSFKNLGIKVKIIFNSVTDNWVPVFTFFSSEKFINFAGWGYEQHIWYKKVLLDDYPYFYIRKDIDESKKIVKAKKYQCFELKGIVRNVYEDKAWIEVEEIKPSTVPCVSEDVLSIAVKANESFKEDNFIETLYFAEKLKNQTLPHDLDIRIKDIKCFSYLQLNLRKDALVCYSNLLSMTGEEKYKMIIDRLKKHSKKDKLNKDTMLYIKKLQRILSEKNVQLEILKKEVEILKKIIASTNTEKNFKTGSIRSDNANLYSNMATSKELNFSNDISFTNLAFECNSFVISGRRTTEGRLDREEVDRMLEKKDRCSKIHKEHNGMIWSKEYIPVDELTKYKKNTNTTTPKFSRRIIERRLDREEFEYLLSNNKKQL